MIIYGERTGHTNGSFVNGDNGVNTTDAADRRNTETQQRTKNMTTLSRIV